MFVHRLRPNLSSMNKTRGQNVGMAPIASKLGEMLAVGVAGIVLGTIAPRCLASVSSLRRVAMISYLAGCVLMMLGATQVTPSSLGLAVVFLPAALPTLMLSIGCHAMLRGQGAELVAPKS